MNNKDLEKNFSVGNPTQENIDYAFKNLIYYLTSCTCLKLYKDKGGKFEKTLHDVKSVLTIYINEHMLSSIKEDTLINIKYDLMELDEETRELNSYFAEWSLLWLESLISLRQMEIKLKEKNNGK